MDTQIPTGKTLGDFKLFTNKKFPLDCDGLNDLQLNDALLSVLGNVGGSQYIIKGCVKTAGTWSAGYIFTPTALYPQGELLYVESGSPDTIYVQNDTDTITASGYHYAGAYLHRYCKHGFGSEQFDLSTFVQVQTNKQLSDRVSVLENTVITPEAIGSMKFWPTLTLPNGWLLCDGSAMSITAYKELFDVIEYTYGGEGSIFRLPPAAGVFLASYKENDTDFGALKKTGGEREHTLTKEEMPNIQLKVQHSINSGSGIGAVGGMNPTIDDAIKTEPLGSGLAHNNLPPYLTLPFIIKAKNE